MNQGFQSLKEITGSLKKLNLKRKVGNVKKTQINNRICFSKTSNSSNGFIEEFLGDKTFAADLFTYNPNSIAIFDLDGCFVAGNKAFLNLFGENPPGDYSLFDDPILVEKDLISQINRVKSGEIVDVSSDIWYDPRKITAGVKAKKVYISAIGLPVRGESGDVEFIAILHKNKTMQKDAELKVKYINSAIEQERSIFNSGPVVVFKWKNESGYPVEYVSQNVLETIGYTPDDFLEDKMEYIELIHEDDKLHVIKEVNKYSRDDIINFNHDPYRVRTKSGKIIWVDDYTTIMRDMNGNITHYLGYIIDITNRVEAEQNLRLSNERLEENVCERTMQLNQVVEELSIKHKALEQKNVALEEILGQIDNSKKQMALQIQSNIQKIAFPILDSVLDNVSESDKRRLSILKSTLGDITSPFASLLDVSFPMLTPRETEICNMVKNGFSCKEISKVLNISVQTVLKQRKVIRKKIGISNKKINLASYLRLLR